jgi:hypothetical protein
LVVAYLSLLEAGHLRRLAAAHAVFLAVLQAVPSTEEYLEDKPA